MNSEGFVCEYKDCKLILECPVTLSCGNSLCQKHLENCSDTFSCFFCDENHHKPINGFVINKSMAKIVDNYFEMDPIKSEIRKLLNTLTDAIKNYDQIEPDAYVYEYFEDIRFKIDLHREEMMKEITDRSEEMLKQLKEAEEKCKQNLDKAVKVNNEKLLNEEIPSWKIWLRNPLIKQTELHQFLYKLYGNFDQIQNQENKFKKKLLSGETIQFEKYEKNNSFGKLSFKRVNFVLSPNYGESIRDYDQHFDSVTSIQVDEKSNKLVSTSYDTTIKIWNLETGECLKTLKPHNNHYQIRILIIPNNKFISTSWDKTIKIWDLNSFKCLNTLRNVSIIYSFCLLPNNKIACTNDDGTIHIWNLDNFTKVKLPIYVRNSILSNLLVYDKNKLIICSWGYKIIIWCLETFECIKELCGHSATIYNLELTSNGILLSSSLDATVKFWNLETGEMIKSIELYSPVYFSKVLTDELIAIGIGNGPIKIFDYKNNQYFDTITTYSSINQIHLLSNGNLLSAWQNGKIKLYKLLVKI